MTLVFVFFFFFKQKTAYEITTGDWSSDVCSSDLGTPITGVARLTGKLRVQPVASQDRSEERRVGKECRLLCRSLWSPYHEKKKHRLLAEESVVLAHQDQHAAEEER